MPSIDPSNLEQEYEEELEGEEVIGTKDIVIGDNKPDDTVVTPEVAQTPAAPFKTFTSQEEYEAFLTEELAKRTPATQTPPTLAEVKARYELYKNGEAPLDWNDHYNKIIEGLVRDLAPILTPTVATELKNMTEKQVEESERFNIEFDKEYNDLSKQGLIPALSTPEGQEINKQISILAATYNLTSIKAGYELWKKMPTAVGGGFDYIPPSKQKINRQKEISSRIGGGGGTGSTKTKGVNYSDIHSKSIDALIQERGE